MEHCKTCKMTDTDICSYIDIPLGIMVQTRGFFCSFFEGGKLGLGFCLGFFLGGCVFCGFGFLGFFFKCMFYRTFFPDKGRSSSQE